MKIDLVKILLAILVLSGCSSNKTTVLDFSLEKPNSRETKYSESLQKLGKMLDVYLDDPVYIQAKDILDSTGVSSNSFAEIPYNITEIIKSSLNKIGRKIIYVHYDPNYIINETRVGATFQRPVPSFLLNGAITEYDRTLNSNGKGANISSSFGGGDSVTDLGYDYKTSRTLSRLTIDLNMMDYKRQILLPQVQSVNSIIIADKIDNENLSFAIHGTGFGFGGSIKEIQGRHAAVRLLSELCVLEIVGKLTAVPYWRCIPDGKADKYVINHIRANFNKFDTRDKLLAIQELLQMYGFSAVKKTGEFDAATKGSLKSYAMMANLNSESFEDGILYESLYLNLPYE
jgi:hypothetical protein